MALRIPHVEGLYSFEQSIALDGARWIVRQRWDERLSSWYLDVFDEPTRSPCLVGMKVNPEWPISMKARDRGPGGAFVALPRTDTPEPLTFESLGKMWSLYYLTRTEVDAGLSERPPSGLTIRRVLGFS